MSDNEERSSAWWSKPDDDPWRPPQPAGGVGVAPEGQAAAGTAEGFAGSGFDREPGQPQAPWPGTPESTTQSYRWGFGQPGPVETLSGPPSGSRRMPPVGVLVAAGAAIALTAGLIGGGLGVLVEERRDTAVSVNDPNASLGSAPAGDANRPPSSVAGIAARVVPSVVSIDVQGGGKKGTGSGSVIRNDGYILTNNHVVEFGADGGKIEVKFSDGQNAPAKIVGRDGSYDLAVIKVDQVTGLKALPLGNSDAVLIGDPVIAVGSPLGLSGTVTAGIISAKDRAVTAGEGGGEASFINALQTDAAINPGNSGGPLVNLQGQVIGVNSAIATLDAGNALGGGQGGNIGLGFSIPINQARRVAEQLMRTGSAVHPIIGVTLDRQYQGDGVRILSEPLGDSAPVQSGGPADKAGLKPGDIITKIDDKKVSAADELIVVIRSKAPGDTVKITYRRGGKENTVEVTLAAAPPQK
jgi:putative serine protease PepD